MYIAERYLRAQSPSGKIVSYLPGDVIPDFASWPQLHRNAHLNQQLVRYEADTSQPVVKQEPVDVTAPQAPVEARAQPAPEAYCADCDRTFKDKNGLRVHRSRAHRAPPRMAQQ